MDKGENRRSRNDCAGATHKLLESSDVHEVKQRNEQEEPVLQRGQTVV